MARKKKQIPMTIEDVQECLTKIKRNKDSDPEHARGIKDLLYVNVLQSIGEFLLLSEAQELAKAALKAKNIKLTYLA